MATPRVAAGALFFDELGRVLLVKPHYKEGWDIPGGYAEPSEPPRAACIREVWEELSLSPSIRSHLVVDWAPAEHEGDKILFIFDGGILSEHSLRQISFRDGELTAWRFATDSEFDELLPARLSRRVRAAIRAKNRGVPAYTEHGTEPPFTIHASQNYS